MSSLHSKIKAMNNTKKRSVITKALCKEICIYNKQHPNTTHQKIADFFNIKYHKISISRSTISKIIKKSNIHLALNETSQAATTARIRNVKNPQIDRALELWITQAITAGMIISGDILKEKAKIFADGFGITGITFSNGWLTRFKKRTGIRRRKFQGEAASAPIETLPTERKRLQEILSSYSLNDIYNADETGLFFRMTPNETLASGPVSGTKKVILYYIYIYIFIYFNNYLINNYF
jgi:hypothetical protein